ncbi:MAG: hypothetical protein ABSE49_26105 [Polyangiaceae bacterium]|jgi:hypothetical protein
MFLCRDSYEHMTDEREGALSGWVAFWYRFHMATCPHCRACRRQLDQTVALSREIPPEDVSDKVLDAALTAFRERHKT